MQRLRCRIWNVVATFVLMVAVSSCGAVLGPALIGGITGGLSASQLNSSNTFKKDRKQIFK